LAVEAGSNLLEIANGDLVLIDRNQATLARDGIALGFLGKFPTRGKRELFLDNRDLFPQIREFTGWFREISNSAHTGNTKVAPSTRMNFRLT